MFYQVVQKHQLDDAYFLSNTRAKIIKLYALCVSYRAVEETFVLANFERNLSTGLGDRGKTAMFCRLIDLDDVRYVWSWS